MQETSSPSPRIKIPGQRRRLYGVASRELAPGRGGVKGGARASGRYIVCGPVEQSVVAVTVTHVVGGVGAFPGTDVVAARASAAGDTARQEERLGGYANHVRVIAPTAQTCALCLVAQDSGLESRKDTAGLAPRRPRPVTSALASF